MGGLRRCPDDFYRHNDVLMGYLAPGPVDFDRCDIDRFGAGGLVLVGVVEATPSTPGPVGDGQTAAGRGGGGLGRCPDDFYRPNDVLRGTWHQDL